MVWIILLFIVGLLLFRFFTAFTKDEDDLQHQTLSEKFAVIVHMINEAAFNGRGEITVLDKREFNLYEDGENQIIKFQYSTGHLTITWKYKCLQKEVVHQRQYNNVRNLSLIEQQRIGVNIIKEMGVVIAKHKIDVYGKL